MEKVPDARRTGGHRNCLIGIVKRCPPGMFAAFFFIRDHRRKRKLGHSVLFLSKDCETSYLDEGAELVPTPGFGNYSSAKVQTVGYVVMNW